MIEPETIEEYKKIFILCLEAAGNKTGDKLLLNVEKALEYSVMDSILKDFSDKCEMGDVVSVMLSSILVPKILGLNFIDPNMEDIAIDTDTITNLPKMIEKVSDEALDIYKKYLKKATEKFCEDRGINLKINFKKNVKKL